VIGLSFRVNVSGITNDLPARCDIRGMGSRLPGPASWLAEVYVPVVPRQRSAPEQEAAHDDAEPGPVLARHAMALGACLLLLLAVIAAAELVLRR
jgi:hypothetical protein